MANKTQQRETNVSPITDLEALEAMNNPFGELQDCITDILERIDAIEARLNTLELDAINKRIDELSDILADVLKDTVNRR